MIFIAETFFIQTSNRNVQRRNVFSVIWHRKKKQTENFNSLNLITRAKGGGEASQLRLIIFRNGMKTVQFKRQSQEKQQTTSAYVFG
jgi:hypothetical protein